MRKTLAILVCIILFANNLRSQDLIVTNSGDSLNCKITKTTREYIHFTLTHNDETKHAQLPAYQIVVQKKDYFTTLGLPVNNEPKEIFPHYRIAVDGGWQYRTAKLTSGMDTGLQNHLKKMKSGFHYDLQAACFFTKGMGIEAVFSQQFFRNNLGYNNLTDANGRTIGSGYFEEKIVFNYIGANYILRFFDSKEKNSWLLSIGFGYMAYNDRLLSSNIENFKITAGTLATSMAVGYDIGLSEDFALGFKLSLMGGTFRNYKQTRNGKKTNERIPGDVAEGLGTIRLSVGLRFND